STRHLKESSRTFPSRNYAERDWKRLAVTLITNGRRECNRAVHANEMARRLSPPSHFDLWIITLSSSRNRHNRNRHTDNRRRLPSHNRAPTEHKNHRSRSTAMWRRPARRQRLHPTKARSLHGGNALRANCQQAHRPPDQLPRPDQATRPGPANL